jgi:hypothetical protein
MPSTEPHLTLPELALRARRPDRWPPRAQGTKSRLCLSGGTDGTFYFAWAILIGGPDGTVVREAAVSSELAMKLVAGIEETTESLTRAGWVRIRDVSVDHGEVVAILDEARTLSVPVAGSSGNDGMDGATYSLSWEIEQCGTELHWWAEGPAEWRALTAWARSGRARLHQLVSPGEPLFD